MPEVQSSTGPIWQLEGPSSATKGPAPGLCGPPFSLFRVLTCSSLPPTDPLSFADRVALPRTDYAPPHLHHIRRPPAPPHLHHYLGLPPTPAPATTLTAAPLSDTGSCFDIDRGSDPISPTRNDYDRSDCGPTSDPCLRHPAAAPGHSCTLGGARLLGFWPWRRSALPDQGTTPLVAGNIAVPSGRNDSACDWWGSTRIGHILILARQHRLHSHTCFHSGTDPIATTRTFPTPARPLPPTRGHAQISAFGILPPPRCSFRTPGGARLLGPRAWAQECSA